MKWLELSISVPAEFAEPLSVIFQRHGHGGVVIEEAGGFNPDEGELPRPNGAVIVRTYLPLDRTARHRREQIDLGVRLVSLVQPLPPLQELVLEESQWEEAWKAHFTVTRVGQRLVVKPTWQEYRPRPSDVVVTLDPGMAFGTGHHPTTRMCLEALEPLVRPGMRVLDLGTGSGILAIACARLGAGLVVALDTDPVAVKAARANARANGSARTITVRLSSLPHPIVPPHAFDLALANISARVILGQASQLAAALCNGGTLVASGFLQEQEDAVRQGLESAGLQVLSTRRQDIWVLIVARQGTP